MSQSAKQPSETPLLPHWIADVPRIGLPVFPSLESLRASPEPLIVAAELLELLVSAGAVVLKGTKACGKHITVAPPGWV